ncbi:sodium:proton exchanger [Amylibacter kogurei]|uniref:Sodium:proton exchanger n=1 Tax=Paramylibacter kogurei TaxID=1889778 RepID=A0A2G5K9C7_9RHOB|nr:calcium/sodium antiporter [Amylibacter kogurei]PIB26148.1 sodium:proton exchanger [Amylibacter kogurei]
MDWLFVIAGLGILVFGGDFLVRGAVALATKLGISALVVSLTVVAFGTSAPELLIAIQAALDGVPELALGNVVGSNTANVLLVLGIPAVLSGLDMKNVHTERNFFLMLFASLIFIVLCFTTPLKAWQGALLLVSLCAILFSAYKEAMGSRAKLKELESEVDDENISNKKMAIFLLVGLVSLPLGAHLLIEGATSIAHAFGVSEAIIGLTLVALGTSLPELATTVMAALRKEPAVAIGNVIGSNMFNLLAIPAIAAFVAPLPVPAEFFRVDLWVMLGASLLMIPFVLLHWNLTRIWGALFVVGYVFYVMFLLG